MAKRMWYQIQSIILLVCLGALLGGCATTTVDSSRLDPRFSHYSVNRIAILPFVNLSGREGASHALRKTFYSHFAGQRYVDLELHRIDAILARENLLKDNRFLSLAPARLADLLQVDGVIYGTVTASDRVFMGLYSQVAVALDLRLVHGASGRVLWQNRQRAAHHEGGLPFNLVSLVPAVFRSAQNMQDEELTRVADDLCRAMVASLPDRPAEKDEEKGVQQPRVAGAPGLSDRRQEEAQTLFWQGVVSLQAEDVEQAVRSIKKAVELAPDNAWYRYNLGLACYEAGDRPQALAQWRRVLELEPGHQSAAVLLARYAGSSQILLANQE